MENLQGRVAKIDSLLRMHTYRISESRMWHHSKLQAIRKEFELGHEN
jgi:hypothetical protein